VYINPSNKRSLRKGERGFSAAGFTLLEVFIAVAIAALALSAIATSNTMAVRNTAQVYQMSTASLLLKGVILDIEESYRQECLPAEGTSALSDNTFDDCFPTNDQYNESCDEFLNDPFDKEFECEYDLEGLEFDEGELESLSMGLMESLAGGGDVMSMMGGGQMASKAEQFGEMFNFASTPALAVFADPVLAQQYMQMCGIKLQNLIMSVMGISQFFPQIVKLAANQTRKLTVRMQWKTGMWTDRKLEVETYIVVIPQEQRELMRMLNLVNEETGEEGELPTGFPGGGGAPGGAGGRGGGGR